MDKKADKFDGLVEGMTLRDWVIGQCIANVFSSSSGNKPIYQMHGETKEDALRRFWGGVAQAAAAAADAMMEESASHTAKLKKATEGVANAV